MRTTLEAAVDPARVQPATSPMRTILLLCGVASSFLYVAMNVLAARRYEGYSLISHTISELSAIGAPSRSLWVSLGLVWNLMMMAFGAGVWGSSGRHRSLRVVGVLLVAFGAIGFVWPPMHQRGQGFTLTDTMHVVVSMVAVLLMLLAMVIGSVALGRAFRLYSFFSILLFVVFGILIGMDGPRIAANLPTPWAGLTERINTGVFLLWLVVLALALLRGKGMEGQAGTGSLSARSPTPSRDRVTV